MDTTMKENTVDDSDTIRLDGRTAIIAGGATGLGAAAARKLAARGASVMIADLNAEGAESLAEELRELGATVLSHAFDIDSAGHVCAGALLARAVAEVSPEGAVTVHHLPGDLDDRLVTNVCFGGPDHSTAFITLSESGRVIAARWAHPGAEVPHGGALRT